MDNKWNYIYPIVRKFSYSISTRRAKHAMHAFTDIHNLPDLNCRTYSKALGGLKLWSLPDQSSAITHLFFTQIYTLNWQCGSINYNAEKEHNLHYIKSRNYHTTVCMCISTSTAIWFICCRSDDIACSPTSAGKTAVRISFPNCFPLPWLFQTS